MVSEKMRWLCVFGRGGMLCHPPLKWFVVFPSLHRIFAIHSISWIVPFMPRSPNRSHLYSLYLDLFLFLVLLLYWCMLDIKVR